MVQRGGNLEGTTADALGTNVKHGKESHAKSEGSSLQLGRIGDPRSMLLVAVLPTLLYLIYAGSFYLRSGYPLPAVHDEFSYLLAADTFAHFRLTNPTPPMWQHFESIHINMIPTYGSMYPPAQGLFLAAGQLAFGHPWWGVVLSSALFIFAMGWASLAWLPRWWALSANVTALALVVGTYWTSSYWGGSVAAAGGALILGAIGRWRQAPSTTLAAIWASGCVILVLSRPYTGGVLILVSAIELLRIFLSRRNDKSALGAMLGSLLKGALPIAVFGIVFLLYYCFQTTGDPLRLPAIENAKQYQIRRLFYGTSDRPEPVYRHDQIRNVYHGLLRDDWTTAERYSNIARFFISHYFGPTLFGAGLIAAVFGWSAGNHRWVFVCAACGFAAILMLLWINPHYYSPYAAFLVTSFQLSLRVIASGPWAKSRALYASLALLGGLFLIRICSRAASQHTDPEWTMQRTRLESSLAHQGSKHLVLVRYAPDHRFYDEWVYNPAEFSTAKVLWARWWTPERNQELADAFKDRKIWIVDPDNSTVELQPYQHHQHVQ